jgi:hypothetical protein
MRFSLRGLFVAVTIIALALGWLANESRHEKLAMQYLSSQLGDGRTQVWHANRFALPEIEDEVIGKPEKPAFHGRGYLWRLLRADIFQTPVSIHWRSTIKTRRLDYDRSGELQIEGEYSGSLVDDDLRWINMLHYLKYLSLSGNDITGRGIAQLRDLRRLETLKLANTTITDDGLEVLLRMPRLRHVDLSYTRVSNKSVDTLSRCSSITELRLVVTNVSDEGIARLQRALPNCQIDQ